MFIPRAVNVKEQKKAALKGAIHNQRQVFPTSSCSQSSKNTNAPITTTVSSTDGVQLDNIKQQEHDDTSVIELSRNQRWPLPGEPVCIVCGRYGEYIVDETDKDVCSIECKKQHLRQVPIAMATTCSFTRGEPSSNERVNEISVSGGDSSRREVGVAAPITKEQASFLRKQLGIMVSSEATPLPIMEFSQLPLINQLSVNLKEAGFVDLTPIQMQVIPAINSGRDLMVSSSTGSGKSLSFLLPIIHRLSCPTPAITMPSSIHKALILSPTRELCVQLETDAKALMKGIPEMLTALLVGGVPLANQLHRLKTKHIKVIVATPGRLKDIIDNHGELLDLSGVGTVVLDEVDSLLEMGFEEQVKFILSRLPSVRQNLLYSATVPVRTQELAQSILVNPIHITVGKPGAPSVGIKHTILWVEEDAKKKQLFSIMEDKDLFHPPTIVFVNSRKGALLLAEALNKVVDVAAVAIHGEMEQRKRTSIFSGMLEGKYEVVVSTGLLARGIHIDNIRQVFVFDMPNTVEEFVHQVGRAGRLDSPGWAFTFINNESKGMFLKLIELFEDIDIVLPQQLVNSPHVTQQRARQTKKRHPAHATTDSTHLIQPK